MTGSNDQRRRERLRGGRRSPPLLARPSASTAPGPRSPSSETNSASKASSKEGTPLPAAAGADEADEDSDVEPAERSRRGAESERSPRSPRSRSPPPEEPEDPSGAEAKDKDTLPCGSMSSTRTSMGWPRVRTSSTLLIRLPSLSDDSFEMWSRPSRPGSTLTKAPNLVMLTTLPA